MSNKNVDLGSENVELNAAQQYLDQISFAASSSSEEPSAESSGESSDETSEETKETKRGSLTGDNVVDIKDLKSLSDEDLLKAVKQGKVKVIEKKVRDGKTFFVVNDYEKLRGLFAQLLGEIQRIKSEGDYEAGKQLIETYAVHIDPELHKEVLERYKALGLKPYGGFVNPEIVPVMKDGAAVDYEVVYTDDYLGQMLQYGKKYGTL